jgi:hypothetical protein
LDDVDREATAAADVLGDLTGFEVVTNMNLAAGTTPLPDCDRSIEAGRRSVIVVTSSSTRFGWPKARRPENAE